MVQPYVCHKHISSLTRTANQAKIIWDGKINKSHMHYVSGDKVLFYYEEPHREEGSAPHSQKFTTYINTHLLRGNQF
jgi:hypothetical protein